jgi:acetoacetyl-CoA synthetase
MGTGEVYAIVDPLPGVADSLVLGIELPEGGYYMPLFVVPEPGTDFTALSEAVGAAIRRDLSPRHVPDEIVAAPAVPRTLTGKKLEIPLKRILLGDAAGARLTGGAISGDDVLEWYATFGRHRVAPLMT